MGTQLTLAISSALVLERAYSTTMDMNSMEPAGGRLSDYFTAAARRVVIPPNAKHLLTVQIEPLSGELSAQAQQRRRNGGEGPSVGDSGATVPPPLAGCRQRLGIPQSAYVWNCTQ